MSDMNGMFISFEGSDASGKSTHIRLLSEKLTSMGYKVLVTREPGGCPISEIIRELVLDKVHTEMTPVAEALLYAAARAQHVGEVIRPALERGEIVITDRYIDSSIAYQGYGRGLGEELVSAINAPATGGLLPDVTFFMSVGTKETAKRMSVRELDRLELAGMSFHDRVFAAFQLLAESDKLRVVTVDATRPKPEVHNAVLAAVCERLQISQLQNEPK
jgi:dTMP kinase